MLLEQKDLGLITEHLIISTKPKKRGTGGLTMASKFKKGKHIFFLFKDGHTVQDSQLKPRYYLERYRAEQRSNSADEIIEYAPLEHGEWIDIFEYQLYCPDIKSTIEMTEQTCSNCRIITTFKGSKQYLPDYYCPNCGSKMDRED